MSDPRLSDLHLLSRPGPRLSPAGASGGGDPFSLGRPGFDLVGTPARALGAAWEASRTLRVLSRTLMVVGVLVLADAAVTMIWQEPITALYAHFQQSHLNGELAKVERAAPTPVQRHVLARLPSQAHRIEFLAREFERHARRGSPIGVIHIPAIGANYVVVKGAGTSELKEGPGAYDGTRFPGVPGTTSIAGHRTTYLAPFHNINELHRGDVIYVDMPYAHFAYTVTDQRAVYPSDVRAATAEVGHSRLVLSACTPLFSAEKRLLVYARLIRTVPERAARDGASKPAPLSTATNTVAQGAEP